jgi:hypothetical protein
MNTLKNIKGSDFEVARMTGAVALTTSTERSEALAGNGKGLCLRRQPPTRVAKTNRLRLRR